MLNKIFNWMKKIKLLPLDKSKYPQNKFNKFIPKDSIKKQIYRVFNLCQKFNKASNLQLINNLRFIEIAINLRMKLIKQSLKIH